uniref:Uncharacterized protein n=1 Tax=Strombidium inclinatum TaxID=197538 RepID=A0A7S3IKT2_9SPIT
MRVPVWVESQLEAVVAAIIVISVHLQELRLDSPHPFLRVEAFLLGVAHCLRVVASSLDVADMLVEFLDLVRDFLAEVFLGPLLHLGGSCPEVLGGQRAVLEELLICYFISRLLLEDVVNLDGVLVYQIQDLVFAPNHVGDLHVLEIDLRVVQGAAQNTS